MDTSLDDWVIKTRDMTKVYKMGEVEVHALRGVTLNIARGEVVAIMGDRAWGAKTMEMEFLGEKAAFPITPYYLVAATGADLVVSLTVRTGRLSFSIMAEHISGDRDWTKMPREEAVKTLLQRYVACLEEYLEKNPYMWFNFFDFWAVNKKGIA